MDYKKMLEQAEDKARAEISEAMKVSKLEWERCPCGSPHCRYMQPKNLGAFNQGTGFLPAEKMRIDSAFEALREKEKAIANGVKQKRFG